MYLYGTLDIIIVHEAAVREGGEGDEAGLVDVLHSFTSHKPYIAEGHVRAWSWCNVVPPRGG